MHIHTLIPIDIHLHTCTYLYFYVYSKPLIYTDTSSSFIQVKLTNKIVSKLYNVFDICINCERISTIKSINTYIMSHNYLFCVCVENA